MWNLKRHSNQSFIFVLGGIMSGLGKGIATSSIGAILTEYGYSVNIMKIDPYLNIDAGNMNPTEHGETFVLSSGLECDQDMGNYERFLNKSLLSEDYLTSGMVYQRILQKERQLFYKGKCVEAIPHVVSEICQTIITSAHKSKSAVQLVELGGTIGDYQNELYIEAMRMLKLQGHNITILLLVPLITPEVLGEMKTRPAQLAIRMLNSYGLQPDIVLARGTSPMDRKRKEKIANSCGLNTNRIISIPDVSNIYTVPYILETAKNGIGKILIELLNLPKKRKPSMNRWKKFTQSLDIKRPVVRIAIAGKYFDTGKFTLSDSYISVTQALRISAAYLQYGIEIDWINAKSFTGMRKNKMLKTLSAYDGIIIPGGFGDSGTEGKMNIITYARENNIPFLGICYGLQLAVIEFARVVCNMKHAESEESKKKRPSKDTKYVIHLLNSQKKHIENKDFGATMRLGTKKITVLKDTTAYRTYKTRSIEERHRHRFYINDMYRKTLERKGFMVSGVAKQDKHIIEIMELTTHPFFVGTQFHPEFKARPFQPHPLFNSFIQASIKHKTTGKKK